MASLKREPSFDGVAPGSRGPWLAGLPINRVGSLSDLLEARLGVAYRLRQADPGDSSPCRHSRGIVHNVEQSNQSPGCASSPYPLSAIKNPAEHDSGGRRQPDDECDLTNVSKQPGDSLHDQNEGQYEKNRSNNPSDNDYE